MRQPITSRNWLTAPSRVVVALMLVITLTAGCSLLGLGDDNDNTVVVHPPDTGGQQGGDDARPPSNDPSSDEPPEAHAGLLEPRDAPEGALDEILESHVSFFQQAALCPEDEQGRPCIALHFDEYALGDEIEVSLFGFSPDRAVRLTVTGPGGNAREQPVVVSEGGIGTWTWLPRPDAPRGEYLLEAEQGGNRDRARLTLSDATYPNLRVAPAGGLPGQEFEALLAGFAPGEAVQLHVYRLGTTERSYESAEEDIGVAVVDEVLAIDPDQPLERIAVRKEAVEGRMHPRRLEVLRESGALDLLLEPIELPEIVVVDTLPTPADATDIVTLPVWQYVSSWSVPVDERGVAIAPFVTSVGDLLGNYALAVAGTDSTQAPTWAEFALGE